jgi:hypothetical protein
MEKHLTTQANFNSMAATFKGLSDPSRLQLLAILLDGEANVGDLERNVVLAQAPLASATGPAQPAFRSRQARRSAGKLPHQR